MNRDQPSRTALRAAAHRAAHQIQEQGRIFDDPLALAVLGAAPEMVLATPMDAPGTRGMRLFIAARSRFAEERLAAAVAAGVRQYVVLGAGLDTFALRNRQADLRVFEVDHPSTQAWKRERLRDAGLAQPACLTYAPVDFERGSLAAGLVDAGFDAAAPAVFAWLGVVIYLTRPAIIDTLALIARGRHEVVFDYSEPHEAFPEAVRAARLARERGMAALGKPWLSRFAPAEMARLLAGLGFGAVEDLGPAEIVERYLGITRPGGPGGHIVSARAAA